jgi:hypothetical protein
MFFTYFEFVVSQEASLLPPGHERQGHHTTQESRDVSPTTVQTVKIFKIASDTPCHREMNLNPEETNNKAFSKDNEPAIPVPDTEPSAEKVVKKRTWKKPKDKPKRPLSSYNIFFRK